jgi:ubiquinone/menaquinone biosynthesis C-methylase UbiE/uncharacterized protein YbaR (Trm112 family)
MSKQLAYCCPLCKGELESSAKEYSCRRCARSYPVTLGIPDFRLFIDSYSEDAHQYKQDDFNQAMFLVEHYDKLDFEGLLRLYLVDAKVTGDRYKRIYANTLTMVDRGIADLRDVEQLSAQHRPINFNSVLEVGCGSGAFLVAASARFKQVAGIDYALRWLILTKKRLEEKRMDVPLACCYAEYLPFDENSFDLVVAEDVIEHLRQQGAFLEECQRVINGKGLLFLKAPNRFSIAPEPHVRVWGVGFLPRKWMSSYVRLFSDLPYENTRLLSFFETKRLLKRASFRDNHFVIPPIPAGELKSFSRLRRIGAAGYDIVRKAPFLRTVLYLVGPFFHILSYSHKQQDPS